MEREKYEWDEHEKSEDDSKNAITGTYWNSSLKSSGGTDPKEYDAKVVSLCASGSHSIDVESFAQ
jgi:hypothetical protein